MTLSVRLFRLYNWEETSKIILVLSSGDIKLMKTICGKIICKDAKMPVVALNIFHYNFKAKRVPDELPILETRPHPEDMATTAANGVKTDQGKAKNPKDQKGHGEPACPAFGVGSEPVEKPFCCPKPRTCCNHILKGLFVIVSIVALLQAIAEIVMTVSTAILTKLYDPEQSSRLVGMIILALLAAAVISVVVNALCAVFRKKVKPLKIGIVVLVVVAVVQAVVLGLTCRVTLKEEVELAKTLQQSFQLAKENNPRQGAIWTSTQNDLSCCGLFGPEDYRKPSDFYSPDVPISCCPAYDSDRSELVQERERELCKSRKAYYYQGCNDLVIEGFRNAARTVLSLTVALMVIEVILMILLGILIKKINSCGKDHDGNEAARDKGNAEP